MSKDGTATLPSSARETPLRHLALAGFEAVCEALYPDNDFGAPSWREADMVRRAAHHWDQIPPEARLTLEVLYAAVELTGAALAPLAGVFHLRWSLSPRLSSMPVEQRFKMFDRMLKSRVWPLRFVVDALKSSSTMVYMSHPAAMRYIGAPGTCLVPNAVSAPRTSAFSDLLNAPDAEHAGFDVPPLAPERGTRATIVEAQ